MVKMKAEVFKIERIKCMCGQNNRKCNHCNAPFEIDAHCDSMQIHNCPRCGNPFNTKTDKVEDAHLRAKFNLIP